MIILAFLTISPHQKPNIEEHNFWHVKKDINNVWWFLSPDGSKNFMLSVGNIIKEQKSKNDGRHYCSKDPKWESNTLRQINQYGFNCAGAWGDISSINYYKVLNIYSSLPDIEKQDWEERVSCFIRSKVEPNDRNLVGYFLDNEIDWDLINFADKYFEVTCRLLRKFDPNHMILGVRFNKIVSDHILFLSKAFDVNSINNYRDDGKASSTFLSRIYQITHKPIIISEFSFYSDDNRSGDKNTKGFGGKVRNQEERGKRYSSFVEGMAACPFIIGTEWFQWADEPPEGRLIDGEDCNFGLVDIYGVPYETLINAAIKTNRKVKLIHKKSVIDYRNPAWD